MKRGLIVMTALALTLAGCGSHREMTRQTSEKSESHRMDEFVHNVLVDTSRSDETTVTVTEWFYDEGWVQKECDSLAGELSKICGRNTSRTTENVHGDVSQLRYKRQTIYERKRTESGITETTDRNTTRTDTVASKDMNEVASVEKGTNTVKGLRNVALIVGLCVLLVVAVIILALVLRRIFRPKIL